MQLDREGMRALAGAKRKRETVSIPGYGDILVQAPSASELALHEASMLSPEGKKIPERMIEQRERYAILGCVSDDGTKLFDETDIAWLGALPSIVLDAVVDKVIELGINRQKPIQDLAGNSVTPRPNGSGCGLRSPSGDQTGANS